MIETDLTQAINSLDLILSAVDELTHGVKWLRIDPRAYFGIEKEKYGLSAASLRCFQCNFADAEILEMVDNFKSRIGTAS